MLLTEIYQLPEKQWCPDINPVVATLTVVGDFSHQTTPFEQYIQKVQLKDESGVSSDIKIQTKFEKGLMAPNMVGKKARWRLKWYQGGQKQVIVGYCLDKMEQAVPSQPQQAPQQPTQKPNASNTPQPRDYDAENKGKCRNALVSATIRAGMITIGDGGDHIGDINYWVEYIMTGKAPPPPAQPNYDPDDIPF